MTDETVRALHGLKLPGMAGCWTSLEETHRLDKLSLRDGMQLMLQHERDTRQANRIARLIRNAGFRLKATMEELETDTTRGIPAAEAADLATGGYIKDGRSDGHGQVILRLCPRRACLQAGGQDPLLHHEHTHREPEAGEAGRT